MKRFILVVLVCISLLALVSCGKSNKAVQESAQAIVDAFSDGDMAAINKTIFGSNGLKLDSELSDIWEESGESEVGVLESVFEYVTLKLEKTTESVIEYEIKAPDMTNVFANIDMDITNITETELLEYIRDYAKNAEVKTTTVSLKYILVDGEPFVDYRSETFVNAVTGGLLDAYKELYSKMMDDYVEGLN